MKAVYFLIIFALITSFVFCQGISATDWTDPVSGTKYDFSVLKRDQNDPWKVKDGADNGLFSMIYYFNFGVNHKKKCKGQEVGVSEVLEVLKQPTDTCEILGKVEARTVGLLDANDPKKGIYVQYGNGDKCTNGDNPMQNGKPRQSRFNIYCSDKQDEFKVDLPGGTQGTTKCILEFRIASPAGCPGGSFSSARASVILFWVVLFLALYFILGTLYNMKQNNMEGKEAIPNIEFWRSFPSYVQEGIVLTMNACKGGVNYIKGKFSGNTSSYSEL